MMISRFVGAFAVTLLLATPAWAADQPRNTEAQAGSVASDLLDRGALGAQPAKLIAGHVGEEVLGAPAPAGESVGAAGYEVGDGFVLGLTLGRADVALGAAFSQGDSEADRFTIAPYAGYIVNRYFTIDVSGGYANMNAGPDRTDPVANSLIGGDAVSDRWFVAGALSGRYQFEQLALAGRVGYLFGAGAEDRFTENLAAFDPERDIDLGQLRIGAQLAYGGGMVQPYLSGTFEYDVDRENLVGTAGRLQPNGDRSGFEVGGGLRFSLSEQVTGGITGKTRVGGGGDDSDSATVSGHVRIEF